MSQQPTLVERRAQQRQWLEALIPARFDALQLLIIVLIFAGISAASVGGIGIYAALQSYANAVPLSALALSVSLLFFALSGILGLLISIDRNQRITHELLIRQLERGGSLE